MNEDLLKAIYDNEGFGNRNISFDQFRNDIMNPELQKAVYENAGFSKKGISFDKFQSDLTGTPMNPPMGSRKPKQEDQEGENNLLDLGFLNDTWLGDTVQDLYRAGVRGWEQGAGVGESLEVLLKGASATDENITDLISAVEAQQKPGISDEMKSFMDAKGFKNSTMAFLENPVAIIAETVVESAMAMGRSGGVAIAGASMTGKAAPLLVPLSLGATSAALETSGKMVESLQEIIAEKGMEFNKESIRAVMEDEDIWGEIRNKAIKKGGVIGLVDAATAGFVTKMGGNRLLMRLANKSKAGQEITSGVVKSTQRLTNLGEFAIEASSGGLGELGGQAAAGEEVDWKSAGLEVFGEIPGGIVSVKSSNVINNKRLGTLNQEHMAAAVQNDDRPTFEAHVKVAKDLGHINEDQATELLESYDEFAKINASIPNKVSDKERRAKITGFIRDRNLLDEVIRANAEKEVDEVFASDKEKETEKLNKKREQLNEKIQETVKIPPTKPLVEATPTENVVQEINVNGIKSSTTKQIKEKEGVITVKFTNTRSDKPGKVNGDAAYIYNNTKDFESDYGIDLDEELPDGLNKDDISQIRLKEERAMTATDGSQVQSITAVVMVKDGSAFDLIIPVVKRNFTTQPAPTTTEQAPINLRDRRIETPETLSQQTANFFSSFGDIIDPTLESVRSELGTNPTQEDLLSARNRMMESDDEGTRNAATRLPTKAADFVTDVTEEDLAIEAEMNKHKSSFGLHIESSIPTFKDSQVKKARAISKVIPDNAVVYDLGGSEGSFIKSIAKATKAKGVKFVNLDASKSMKNTFDKTPVEGTEFIAEAFGEGFDDNGTVYETHIPKEKADVVHESMLFQFISPDREAQVKEIKDNYLKDDGVLILEEKVFNKNWKANEDNKNKNWKPQHFSETDIALKEKQVGVTGDQIVESIDDTGQVVQSPKNITGMNAGVITDNELRSLLEKNFSTVEEYWDGGNFKGYIASNSSAKVQSFMDALGGPVRSQFSNQESTAPTTATISEFKSEKTLPSALSKDGYAILTASQEGPNDTIDMSQNETLKNELIEEFGQENVEEIKGTYNGVDQGPSFIVTGISENRARAIGSKYKQESIVTKKGIVYSDTGDVNPNKGTIMVGEQARSQPYQSIVIGKDGKEIPFAMDIDFDTTIKADEQNIPDTDVAQPVEKRLERDLADVQTKLKDNQKELNDTKLSREVTAQLAEFDTDKKPTTDAAKIKQRFVKYLDDGSTLTSALTKLRKFVGDRNLTTKDLPNQLSEDIKKKLVGLANSRAKLIKQETSIKDSIVERNTEQEKIDQAVEKEIADELDKLFGEQISSKDISIVSNALKSIDPEVVIQLHDTDEAYTKATVDGLGRAQYDPATKTIHLNQSKSGKKELYHEAAHVVYTKLFAGQPDRLVEWADAIRDVLAKGNEAEKAIAEALDDFTSRYEQQHADAAGDVTLEQLRAEEFFVELTAMIADNKAALTPRAEKGIVESIKQLLSRLFGVDTKTVSNIDDIIDLLNTIATGLREGDLGDLGAEVGPTEPGKRFSNANPINVAAVRAQDKAGSRVGRGLIQYTKDKVRIVKDAPELSVKYVRENAPDLFVKQANLLASYPLVKGIRNFGPIKSVEQAQEVFDVFVKAVSDNLVWLHDQFRPDLREISTLWYDGANKIANELADKYGKSPEQVAGIMAALSPQQDWFKNLRMAELVLETFEQNPQIDSAMVAYQEKINNAKYISDFKAAQKKEGAEKTKAVDKARETKDAADIVLARLKTYIGKNLSEVPIYDKMYFARLANDSRGNKDYNVVRPDGVVVGQALTSKGVPAKVAWGSYGEIGKAVSIYFNGSQENISQQLGEQHKVRNFYNNIIDPMSPDGDVTMDTHAVAAALLLGLSAQSKQVLQNFGADGGGKSGPAGISGTYHAYSDAYADAANRLGLLPRQVQSITWEAVRGLFEKTFKKNPENKKKVNDVWVDFQNGKINIDEAREKIKEISGGITTPSWGEFVSQEPGTGNRETSERGGDGGTGQVHVGKGRGGVGKRLSIYGEKGAAALDKAEEASIRMDNLDVAKQMEKDGSSPQLILEGTGWQKGVDNLWRYEVDPDFAGIRDIVDIVWDNLRGKSATIEMQSYEIFGEDFIIAYPELANLSIVFDNRPNNKKGLKGSFNYVTNTITSYFQNNLFPDGDLNIMDVIGTIVHEKQHSIQNIEGFETGSSPEMAAKKIVMDRNGSNSFKDTLTLAKAMVSELENLKPVTKIPEGHEIAFSDSMGLWGVRNKDTGKFVIGAVWGNDKDTAKERALNYFTDEKRINIQSEIDKLTKVDFQEAYNNYKKFAGEVEARNVERRLTLSPEKRRVTLLEATESISREDQGFIRDSVKGILDLSMSFDIPAENTLNPILPTGKRLSLDESTKNKIKQVLSKVPNVSNEKLAAMLSARGIQVTPDEIGLIRVEMAAKAVPQNQSQAAPQQQPTPAAIQAQKIGASAPGQGSQNSAVNNLLSLLPINEVVREIRSKLLNRTGPIGPLVGSTTVEAIIFEAAQNHITTDGSFSRESVLAHKVIAGTHIPDAAETIALGYAALRLQNRRLQELTVYEKSKAQNHPDQGTYYQRLSNTENQLEGYLKAIEVAGSRTGLAFRMRQEVLTFDRFSETGIAKMYERALPNDEKLSDADKRKIAKDAEEIRKKQQEVQELMDKKKEHGDSAKESIAESEVKNLKAKMGDKGKDSVKSAGGKIRQSKNLDAARNQLNDVLKGKIC